MRSSQETRALLGRRWRCGAGGHSMGNTGPESSVPPAAPTITPGELESGLAVLQEVLA